MYPACRCVYASIPSCPIVAHSPGERADLRPCVYHSHRVPMGMVHDGTETPRDWYTTGAEVGRDGTEASTVVFQSHEPQWVLWTQKLMSTLLRILS